MLNHHLIPNPRTTKGLEEDGAVKTEEGEEQNMDGSNDGADVRPAFPPRIPFNFLIDFSCSVVCSGVTVLMAKKSTTKKVPKEMAMGSTRTGWETMNSRKTFLLRLLLR